MKSSYGPAPIERALALTIPIVTVWPKPKGLPTAITSSPTRSAWLLPNVTADSSMRVPNFNSAMSSLASRPTTRALS